MVTCDNCQKKLDRHAWCDNKCKMIYRYNTNRVNTKGVNDILDTDRVKPSQFTNGYTSIGKKPELSEVKKEPKIKAKLGGTGFYCKFHKTMQVGNSFTCGCIIG